VQGKNVRAVVAILDCHVPNPVEMMGDYFSGRLKSRQRHGVEKIILDPVSAFLFTRSSNLAGQRRPRAASDDRFS